MSFSPVPRGDRRYSTSLSPRHSRRHEPNTDIRKPAPGGLFSCPENAVHNLLSDLHTALSSLGKSNVAVLVLATFAIAIVAAGVFLRWYVSLTPTRRRDIRLLIRALRGGSK